MEPTASCGNGNSPNGHKFKKFSHIIPPFHFAYISHSAKYHSSIFTFLLLLLLRFSISQCYKTCGTHLRASGLPNPPLLLRPSLFPSPGSVPIHTMSLTRFQLGILPTLGQKMFRQDFQGFSICNFSLIFFFNFGN